MMLAWSIRETLEIERVFFFLMKQEGVCPYWLNILKKKKVFKYRVHHETKKVTKKIMKIIHVLLAISTSTL